MESEALREGAGVKKDLTPQQRLAKMRRNRNIKLGLIDLEVLDLVDKILRAAERATSLRVRGRRRLYFTGAVYNLMVLGEIDDQAALEQWLRRRWTGEDAS